MKEGDACVVSECEGGWKIKMFYIHRNFYVVESGGCICMRE